MWEQEGALTNQSEKLKMGNWLAFVVLLDPNLEDYIHLTVYDGFCGRGVRWSRCVPGNRKDRAQSTR